jgi:hypothetical protein
MYSVSWYSFEKWLVEGIARPLYYSRVAEQFVAQTDFPSTVKKDHTPDLPP